MFSKLLIANRGEIACRIIRTAREMGIATVAVFSDADREALHVRMADEAVHIGPSPSAESYLVIDRIIKAAKDTGAEAVHPGFGFLSENGAFCEALQKANIVFIGPPATAISAMGDKIESKKLAEAAGVSTVPGHLAAIADAKEAAAIAAEIGFPVMLKASAGGGGKGMRIARDETEVAEGFVSAQNEANASFGDDRVFVEKFIEEPRHIEIQVLADSHGNCIYLGERECSIQRRHQKVIEEAPSPFVDAGMREAMGAQTVALAQAVAYQSAGTVEFIVDVDRNFYFLEMNTRLQVEHPVTELITGIDLVAEMITIAAGEPLSLGQDDVALNGWAMECRLYAEDPGKGFLPSIGRLTRCRPPAENAAVRVDTGVEEGSEITMYYDPMIAKLVTHGEDRAEAAETMRQALDVYYVRGINHNLSFLTAVITHQRFLDGHLSTAFIDQEYGASYEQGQPSGQARDVVLGTAGLVHCIRTLRDRWAEDSGSLVEDVFGQWVTSIDGQDHAIEINANDDGVDIAIDGRTIVVDGDWEPGQVLFEGRIDGREVAVQIDSKGAAFTLTHGGYRCRVRVLRPRAAALAALMPAKAPPDHSNFLLAPMSGLVVAIHVAPGDEVKAGQSLAVIEAMKMENVLRAERDCIVAAVNAGQGDSISAEQVILEFDV